MAQMPQSEEDMMNQGMNQDGKGVLLKKLEDLRNKRGEFNAIQFAGKNQAENYRMEALQQVFDVMRKYGIDPSNIDEVTAFINKLEQENPELYQVFIQAFEQLLGSNNGLDTSQMGQQAVSPMEQAGTSLPMGGALGSMIQQGQQPPTQVG